MLNAKWFNRVKQHWTKTCLFHLKEHLWKKHRGTKFDSQELQHSLRHTEKEKVCQHKSVKEWRKKMGLYVTEEIYTDDWRGIWAHHAVSLLTSQSRGFRAALLSLNRKLSGTSGMTAQAVWRQQQILPGRIGNDCGERSLSKCSHTKTNLSRRRSDKHVAPFSRSSSVSSAVSFTH